MTKNEVSRLAEAFAYAATEHRFQLRKSTDIPYISHLMSVSALIMEHGGDLDQAIAGLLHDVIEDCKPQERIPEIKEEIRSRFGLRVLELVEGCTDGEPDGKGGRGEWKPRKEAYLTKLETKSQQLLLVSCCDKLHNARAILTDLLTHGNEMFTRFTASQEDTIWYYDSLSKIFAKKLNGCAGKVAARELAQTVKEIKKYAAEKS